MSTETPNAAPQPIRSMLRDFLDKESSAGIILMFAAALAILVANSPLEPYYQILLDVPVEVRVGALEIAKPLLLWINDGLMALFFLLVGLELKREFVQGELSQPSNVLLPAVGAVGGIVFPILLYWWISYEDSVALRGWAIPAATDIAFALGILMLLGNRVPVTVKVFLVSLAIFDDVGAIVIIAIFYSTQLSVAALLTAAACIAVLSIMAWRKVSSIPSYIVVGFIMWVAVLKSGVHATLAAVILAMFIPMEDSKAPGRSPLRELEHSLHGVVAFGVLPVFAFANAGVSFAGVTLADLFHTAPLGIAIGLFVGKQVGVFGLCWLTIKLGLARLPEGANWGSLYGVSVLAGVGFTMSLFIGGLAFENVPMNEERFFDERLGILLGSLLSGVVGYFVLRVSLKPPDTS